MRIELNKRKIKKGLHLLTSSFIALSACNVQTWANLTEENSLMDVKSTYRKPVRPIEDTSQLTSFAEKSTDRPHKTEEILIYPPHDRRILVSHPRSFPWKSIGKLEMTFPNGKPYVGTGTLIADNLVLTAGHCLYSRNKGGFLTKCKFSSGGKKSFSVSSKTVLLPEEWKNNESSGWDFGLIVLKHAIKHKASALNIVSADEKELQNHRLLVAGHPGEKRGLWFMAGNLYRQDQDHLYYQIDTTAGQSGGPICFTWKDNRGRYRPHGIVGVHSSGWEENPRFNSGVFFNKEKIDMLHELMARSYEY